MDPNAYLSFKVYLDLGDNSKPEVRRFGVTEAIVTNYLLLKDKIRSMFPFLKNSSTNFKIGWKDQDNDLIDITSDEELIIALTEMADDELRKLFVTVLPNQTEDFLNLRGAPNVGPLHQGVVCDGCAGIVQGYRYKCLQCPDFDLCNGCEVRGVHSDHFMIRLSTPMSLRSHFTRGLAHRLSKAYKKHERKENRGHKHGCHDSSNKDRRPGDGCPANNWLSDLLAHLSTVRPEEPESQQQQGQSQPQQSQSQPQQGQSHPQQEGHQQHQDQQPKENQQKSQENQFEKHATFEAYQEYPNCVAISELINDVVGTCLNNVGPIVEKIVEPLIFPGPFPHEQNPEQPSAESAEKKAQEAKESSPSENLMDVTVDDKTQSSESDKSSRKSEDYHSVDGGKEKQALDEMDVDHPPTFNESTATPIPRDQSVEVDGWTVLSPGSPQRQAVGEGAIKKTTEASPSENNEQLISSEKKSSESLYPSLPAEMISKNPKVNESLATMLSMGFTNSDGWLLHLLEVCNGEIEKVCQMLEPVMKNKN